MERIIVQEVKKNETRKFTLVVLTPGSIDNGRFQPIEKIIFKKNQPVVNNQQYEPKPQLGLMKIKELIFLKVLILTKKGIKG